MFRDMMFDYVSLNRGFGAVIHHLESTVSTNSWKLIYFCLLKQNVNTVSV